MICELPSFLGCLAEPSGGVVGSGEEGFVDESGGLGNDNTYIHTYLDVVGLRVFLMDAL